MEIQVNINAPDLAEAITKLAYAISQTGISASVSTAVPPTAKKEEPKPAPTKKEEPKADTPAISLETVRIKLTELAQSGKQAQVKELLTSLGFKKLSEVPETQYAELMEKASEL